MLIVAMPPVHPSASRRRHRRVRRERSPEAVQFWRGLGLVFALLGVVTASTAAAVWFDVAATRPPCPPGYVRFIDLGSLMGWVCLGLAVVALLSGGLAWVLRGSRVLVVFIAVLLAIALLLGAAAGVSGHDQHGQTTDTGCWTFDRRTPHPYGHGGSGPVGATIGRRPVPGAS